MRHSAERQTGLVEDVREPRHATIVHALQHYAQSAPDEPVAIFLEDGEHTERTLTYGELVWHAHQLATQISMRTEVGERVLILQPTGLEYLISFFGCLLAGAIPVPLYPPRRRDRSLRVEGVVTDCRPTLALVTRSTRSRLDRELSNLQQICPFEVVEVDAGSESAPSVDAAATASLLRLPESDDVAFLQYTSGSTTRPRGVVVLHRNLAANEEMIRLAFGNDETTTIVSWLPLHHDMGLIGSFLQSVWLGRPIVMMKPSHFFSRPARWLEAIAKYRGTAAGAPNFAFDLCRRSLTASEILTLDLKCWKTAFNGAEPVRARTLVEFAEAFSPAGFDMSAFLPCYGLAEATLLVGAKPPGTRFRTVRFGPRGTEFVSCGPPAPAVFVAVADPLTSNEVENGTEGEIWTSGPGVAHGYWNEADDAGTFDGTLVGDDRRWLRTGDLGFIEHGELVVTGRAKDVIVHEGVNHYPQDLEALVAASHPAFAGRPGAAVTAALDQGASRLIILQEVRRGALDLADLPSLGDNIRRAIINSHGLELAEVVLVPAGELPLTSSGKVRRGECRVRYETRTLNSIAAWCPSEPASRPPGLGAEDTIAWLRDEVADLLGIQPDEFSDDDDLLALGIDSVTALALRNSAESRFGTAVPLQALLQGATIRRTASFLVASASDTGTVPGDATFDAGAGSEGELAEGQKALWFLHQLNPTSSEYNIVFAARILGELDGDRFRAALREVLSRHDELRTQFRIAEDGTPRATVIPLSSLDEGRLFGSTRLAAHSEEKVLERLAADANMPFDLANAPLLRINTYHVTAQGLYLLIAAHHIVADVVSLTVLMNEIAGAYDQLKSGRDVNLGPAGSPYRDFVARQRTWLNSAAGQAALAWWESELSGSPQALDLPSDRPRPTLQSHSGGSAFFVIDDALSDGIRLTARERGVTLNTLLLAAYAAMLHLLSGSTDVVIGVPTNGRTSHDFERTVGYFVNPIAVRVRLNALTPTRELIEQVRDRLVESMARQEVPFTAVVDRLLAGRDPSSSPIFQAMFTLEKSHENQAVADFIFGFRRAHLAVGSIELESVPLPQQEGQFDLDLSIVDSGGSLSGALQFNADIFVPSTIDRWRDLYLDILRSLVDDTAAQVGELVHSGGSRHASITGGAAQAHDAPTPISDRIRHSGLMSPWATALVDGSRRFSHAELEHCVNDLAEILKDRGIDSESRVAIVADRDSSAVIAMLAVWRVGAACVPVDSSYPPTRVRAILSDSAPDLTVIADATNKSLASEFAGPLLRLDEANGGSRRSGSHVAPRTVLLDATAYVVFTSGSTGRPKGVAVSHRSLAEMYVGWASVYDLQRPPSVLQLAPVSFDVFIGNVVRALASGGCLVLADRHDVLDPEALYNLIRAEHVDFVEFVPTLFREFMDHVSQSGLPLDGLRTVVIGSDTWYGHEYRSFAAALPPSARLVNSYGATETTVENLTFEDIADSNDEAPVPLGHPLANTSAYVLSPMLLPVPIGALGELYIAGAGVARGYVGAPGTTAERFVPDPFGTPGARMYRTGDLARMRPDGSIEFRGRADRQIKVNGHRIEPGEVEKAILDTGGPRQALVTLASGGTGTSLVAYVVPEIGADAQQELREALRQTLPPYLVPSSFVSLDAFPLTANGKIDQTSLPRAAAASERSPEPAKTASERTLARIFAEVLDVDAVGADESFFELGGDSVMSMQVVSRARREGLFISASDLYECQTVAALALRAEETAPQGDSEERESGPVPLTGIQQWFFSREHPNPSHWNQAVLLTARTNDLDLEGLGRAFEAVVAHHDAFRLRFHAGPDGWEQRLTDDAQWPGLSVWRVDDADDHQRLKSLDRPHLELSLDHGPVTRAAALVGRHTTEILWLAHHLVVDGVSWRILLEDLVHAYDASVQGASVALAPVGTSFKKWAREKHSELPEPTVNASGYHGLRRDHELGRDTEGSARVVTAEIDSETTMNLVGLTETLNGSRVDDVLVVAAARAAEGLLSDASEIAVDLESHGRPTADSRFDLSRTVGWFTSIATVRVPVQHTTVLEQIGAVRHGRRSVAETEFPAADSAPTAGISVNYLGALDNVLPSNGALALSRAFAGAARDAGAPRDYAFEIDCEIFHGRLVINVTYSGNFYRSESAQVFLRRLVHHLESVTHMLHESQRNGASHPTQRFDVPGLTPTEVAELLKDLEGHL